MEEGLISFIFTFPKPWSPNTNVIIIRREEGNLMNVLYADKKVRLCFHLKLNNFTKEYCFQPIILEGSGKTNRYAVEDPKVYPGGNAIG